MAHISSEHRASLRALLNRDDDEALRGIEQLVRASESLSVEVLGFMELMSAALIVAARRHFGERFTRAEIVQYVAAVRQSDSPMGDFDPLTGEILILRALGVSDDLRLDQVRQAMARIALLDAFVSDAGLDAERIDELLETAVTHAPVWFPRSMGADDLGAVAKEEMKTITSIFLPGAERPIFSLADLEDFTIGDETMGKRFGVGASGESFLCFTEGRGGIYVQTGPTAVFANTMMDCFTATLVAVAPLGAPPGGIPSTALADGDGYLKEIERVRAELGTIDPHAAVEGAWWSGVLDEFAKAGDEL